MVDSPVVTSSPPEPTTVRERFARAVSVPDAQLDLGEAALLIAAEEYDGLDVTTELARLDELARQARIRIGDVSLGDPDELVRRFHRFLFGELGFKGNDEDYYDPRNSFLNDVLERRTGLPITLAAVYLEIGRRLGFPLEGVGFPGHFLAKWVLPGDETREIVVDPFHGSIVSERECRDLLERLSGGQLAFRPEMLDSLPTRGILARMLSNLKAVWIKRGDYVRAVSACDRILLLYPDAHAEMRDRGLLWLKLECFRPALVDLETFLTASPNAPDAKEIAEQLVPLRQLVARIS